MIAGSLAEFERLSELAPCAFVLFEPHGRIVLANAGSEELFGCPREELLGLTIDVLLPALSHIPSRDARQSHPDPVQLPGSALEPDRHLYARRKNGSELAVAVSLNRVKLDTKALLLALICRSTERSEVEESMLHIAKGVSAATGETFFRSLVEHLARSLEADHAFIGELMENKLERVRTIAVYAHGQIVDNFEYGLTHTPCRQVVSQSMCSYPSGVQQLFPKDRLLADMKVEGYVGTPLFDSSGRALGLMVVLYSRPIAGAGDGSADSPPLAGQCARAAERDRARRDPVHRRGAARAAARIGTCA
ncbi:MAG: PAS domain-containing protein [Gammaproteobacteria bacterium]